MDWEAFRTQLVNHIDLKTRLKSRQDIDDAVNNLTTSIQQAAWSSSIIPDPLNPPTIFHILSELLYRKKGKPTLCGKELNISLTNDYLIT